MSGPRLQGLRILVTRPRNRSEELCFLLEEEGAEVVALPMLELEPPSDGRALRAAAETLGRFSWVAFASVAGVEALAEAARVAGTTAALRRLKVAVVGAATARAALTAGLQVHLVCEGGTGTALGKELAQTLLPSDEVLLPTAEEGRPELEAAFAETTTAQLATEAPPSAKRGTPVRAPGLTRVPAYRSTRLEVAEEVWADLRARPPVAVLFASPRTAEAFLEAGGRAVLAQARVVAIGPTTAAALASSGFKADGVAERPSSAELVEAAVRAIRG
ncbi:MAG: uroporphyrinogen-III synthase [Myxococcaceae bacterium]